MAAHLRSAQGRTAAQVENISMGGMFVRTDQLVEVGTELFVDLVKPGWKKQLTLTARISSRIDAIDSRLSKRMPGMGLQFLKLDDGQHERLGSLLRELGAPDGDLEVTLPREDEESELQALELDVTGPEAEPLDPRPQPLWQQAEMARQESSPRPLDLVADIERALQDADLPPPGPVQLQEQPRQPAARSQTPPPPLTPSLPPQVATTTALETENARLMMQLRGLVMQLSDAQQLLAQRDADVEKLREELDVTRAALRRALGGG